MTYKTGKRLLVLFRQHSVDAALAEYETKSQKTRWKLLVRGYTGRVLEIKRPQDALRFLLVHGEKAK